MTAHLNTKSRRVGLPAEAVIFRGSELAYRSRITPSAHSHGAHGFAVAWYSRSIRLRFRCSMSARQPTRPDGSAAAAQAEGSPDQPRGRVGRP